MSEEWITLSLGVYENKMDQKTIVRGVGLGAGCAFILLAILLALLYCRARRRASFESLEPVNVDG